jgi:hypothetical protein
MNSHCCLDVPKNVSRFLRVFSVIIEIINYAFKFGKCASSAHIFFLISEPPPPLYFRRGVNFAIFSQTVRVGSNFAKIGKSKIKNFTISALS